MAVLVWCLWDMLKRILHVCACVVCACATVMSLQGSDADLSLDAGVARDGHAEQHPAMGK